MSLIEREDALKVICDAISLYGTGNRVESEILVSVSHLPSAERKGRWVFTRYFVWECSECGKNPTKGMGYTQSRSELFRFCPNCGTEMEVTEMTKEKIDSIRERMCDEYCKLGFGPQMTSTAYADTKYFCKSKGVLCSLATEYGYCRITACIIKGGDADE